MQFKTLIVSTLAGLAAAQNTVPLSTAPVGLSTGVVPLPTGTGGVISTKPGGIYSNSTFISKPAASTEETTATVTSKVGAGASSTSAAASASTSGNTNGANLDRKSEFGMVVIGLVVAAGFAI
ncbi:hypothetical protein NEUTE1DRAFT_130652 [Neurospora tetrasperma FGSC 2508]|uniref:Uncharacterized protein n=1 Tax=Neurospora tetrasperma (strain FGSC 2508 / ATCC MYA-4615 / P0657) TaxID=510951 RepID=F8MR45_NEUT8|nr:uncharacterized protein NEUTE1DRAFT_130652 [Neurospora tetrasperma FGSC 2508]EGO56825.1 hypothetical protein NEUTE1DRAFT_130652 [Neurospora tetrasperma FGSC 2508]EGZ70285.1 hypothetical protein NEUTE2DRAFT_112907 [Neurospora tetrasperma FGSC 2509]